MNRLPTELHCQILGHLSWKEQAAAPNVCRLWRELLMSASFRTSRYYELAPSYLTLHKTNEADSVQLHQYLEENHFIQLNFECCSDTSPLAQDSGSRLRITSIRHGNKLNAAWLRGEEWSIRYAHYCNILVEVGERAVSNIWDQKSSYYRRDVQPLHERVFPDARDNFFRDQELQLQRDRLWLGTDPRLVEDVTNSAFFNLDIPFITASNDETESTKSRALIQGLKRTVLHNIMLDFDSSGKKWPLFKPSENFSPEAQANIGDRLTSTTGPDLWWLEYRSLADGRGPSFAKMLNVFPEVEQMVLEQQASFADIFGNMTAWLNSKDVREHVFKKSYGRNRNEAYSDLGSAPGESFSIRVWNGLPRGGN